MSFQYSPSRRPSVIMSAKNTETGIRNEARNIVAYFQHIPNGPLERFLTRSATTLLLLPEPSFCLRHLWTALSSW